MIHAASMISGSRPMSKESYKLTDSEIVSKVKEMRESIAMGNADLFERMEKGKQFTYRDQWDPAVRAYNTKKKKFTLSVPLIKPIIKQVVGMQLTNPKDLKVEANRGGSEVGSRILNKLAKHSLDTSKAMFHRTQWFEAGLAGGVGYIGVFINKNDDPKNGNLDIVKLDENDCGIDADCNVYDINDFYQGAKCFIWEPWVDKELVKLQYPDKAPDLGDFGTTPISNDVTGFWSRLWGGFRSAISTLSGERVLHSEKMYENKYHLTHAWWRRPKECLMLYDERKGDLDAILLKKDKDIRTAKGMAKAHPDIFSAWPVIRQVMCHTICLGDLLLEHKEDELNGVDMFPVVPFSPYFDCGWRGGMAEDLIGTQEEINFSHSMKMNILKKLPNSGWYVKSDPTGAFSQWLEEHGSEDNIVIDMGKAGGAVEKITETQYPVGFERTEEQSIKNIHLISGVRSEDSSYDAANLSGRALLAKQQSSMTGNSPILQNFDFSQTILNNLIVEIIRANKVYSIDEILEIVDSDEMIDGGLMEKARQQVIEEFEGRGIKFAEQPPAIDPRVAQLDKSYTQNYLADLELVKKQEALIDNLARPVAMDMLHEELSNLTKGRYNSTVTMSPYSPTMRMAEMAEKLEINDILIKSGLPERISARRLIESSSITNKDEIIKEMEAAGQMQQLAMAAGR